MVDAADRPEAEGGSHARDASQQLAALRRDSRQSPSAGSDEPSNAQIVRRAMDRYRMLAEAMLNRGDRCFIYPVVGIGNDCADRFGYLYLYGPGLFEPALPALGSGSARFP